MKVFSCVQSAVYTKACNELKTRDYVLNQLM